MPVLLVCFVTFLAAALTFVSGFGLGTILLPVFALLYPLPVAVAATAVVHLLNNIFKLLLLGRHADWRIVVAVVTATDSISLVDTESFSLTIGTARSSRSRLMVLRKLR